MRGMPHKQPNTNHYNQYCNKLWVKCHGNKDGVMKSAWMGLDICVWGWKVEEMRNSHGSLHRQRIIWKESLFILFLKFICLLFYFTTLYWFCHTLIWICHGFTCLPHPEPPSHLPLHPIPLGLPSAPGPSTCLMHPACFTIDNIHLFILIGG